MTVGAIGVVFGDIGTSPLYARQGNFAPAPRHRAHAGERARRRCRSIFWSLMIVVSLKYVLLIMRADNSGEGGIMALLALAQPPSASNPAH